MKIVNDVYSDKIKDNDAWHLILKDYKIGLIIDKLILFHPPKHHKMNMGYVYLSSNESFESNTVFYTMDVKPQPNVLQRHLESYIIPIFNNNNTDNNNTDNNNTDNNMSNNHIDYNSPTEIPPKNKNKPYTYQPKQKFSPSKQVYFCFNFVFGCTQNAKYTKKLQEMSDTEKVDDQLNENKNDNASDDNCLGLSNNNYDNDNNNYNNHNNNYNNHNNNCDNDFCTQIQNKNKQISASNKKIIHKQMFDESSDSDINQLQTINFNNQTISHKLPTN